MIRTPAHGRGRAHPALSAALAVLLAGCSTLAPTATPAPTAAAPAPVAPRFDSAQPSRPSAAAPSPSNAASAAGPNAPRTASRPPRAAERPGQPPAFAKVLDGATRRDGFLPLWERDEQVWIEVPKALQDQPFFFSLSLSTGLGERFVLPGLMGDEQVVSLRKVGQTVQFVARNLSVRGPQQGPLATAIAESFSDSLLAAVPLAAAPHPDSGAWLVDARALLGGDLPGMQTALAARFRLPYALDRANSSFTRTQTGAGGTSFDYQAHFALPKMPPPEPPDSKTPASRRPAPPKRLPDPRSLFVGLAYTLAPLPAVPMQPRRADPRVGYFTRDFLDLSDELGGDRPTPYIARWRLEKQQPEAALSPPKRPIRVVMDRNIPVKWRPAVRAGILKWNGAFERAGFQDAIAVEQQADDATDRSVEGTGVLAVRWFAMQGPGATAVGPSQVDPRTGEILRAAAIIPENWVRIGRTQLADAQPRLPELQDLVDGAPEHHAHGGIGHRHDASCQMAELALAQHQMGFDLMVARGEIDPTGPQADAYIADSLTEVTMHEVGHALGLRHNFKASTALSQRQLRSPGFTATHGISASVMDYNALNLPLADEPLADVQMKVLGPYDLWAIEWGYRPFAPEQEAASLRALAEQGQRDPLLVYGTDEDAAGPDPSANRFDLGEDPLAHARRQLRLSRELWTRTAQRPLGADDDMTLYRRNLARVLAGYASAVPLVTRHVGGLHTRRVTAGAGLPLFEPVSAERQSQALDFVVDEVFSSDSFRFDPKLMQRLGVDQFARDDSDDRGDTDFSLPQSVLRIQRSALMRLMSASLSARLSSAEDKVDSTRRLMSYARVQQRLTDAIWTELDRKGRANGGHIDTLRRNLQREHLRRLVAGMLVPGDALTSDVPAVHRAQAEQLQKRLKTALRSSSVQGTTRAHLTDTLRTLEQALDAPLVRPGV